MSVATRKLTVAEYRELPRPKGGWWELHHGELVKVTFPVHKHNRIQLRLLFLLAPICGKRFVVAMEFAFRPEPEHELWSADLGAVPEQRWAAIDPDGWMDGAPDLAIEILSPSNTPKEIRHKQEMCMANGCKEFWVVDPDKMFVRVIHLDREPKTYFIGGLIPLDVIGGGALAVSEIFEVNVEQQGAL